MLIKCLVSCHDANGKPTFYPCRIKVSRDAYANGQHYRWAAEKAAAAGYQDVGPIYDEKDGPACLFAEFFPTGDPVQDLPHARLSGLVADVRGILWYDDGQPEPDKQWDAETIELVADVLRDAGLEPDAE